MIDTNTPLTPELRNVFEDELDELATVQEFAKGVPGYRYALSQLAVGDPIGDLADIAELAGLND